MIREADRLSHIREYYFSHKLREVAAMVAAGKPVLNLGIGNPDGLPSAETIQTLQEAAEDPGMHGYQPYKGIPALRSAMAAWYADTYSVSLDPEAEILPLIGSKEGISHIAQAFLNPGDVALVPDPGYPAYASATYLAGAEPVAYNLDEARGWVPDIAAIPEDMLQRAKIWWINYPNMPTGARGDVAMLAELVEIARKYDILLVNDNPYSLVLNDGQPLSIHQVSGSKGGVLELNSLSKSHNMAGWRVGLLTGAASLINSVLKVKSNMDSGMFRPIQEAAVKALKNPDSWHAERNAIYAGRKAYAGQILDSLRCSYDKASVGMFLWGRIPDHYEDVETLTERLLHEVNVFITPGFIFGENGKRYVRISLCASTEVLEEAAQRIQKLTL